jgi:hypothetical protein
VLHDYDTSPGEPCIYGRDLYIERIAREGKYFIHRDKFCMDLWGGLHVKDENGELQRAWERIKVHLLKPSDSSGGKSGDNVQATPETDPQLIYQADAADFYNIPKSTLSKAAKKKEGEAGYLWSGRKGKRVFYRKKDLEKLARSRTQLSKLNP